MLVNGRPTRSIWHDDAGGVTIIDQTALPHAFRTRQLHTLDDAVRAIADMWVRGAPLIGVTAAYGMALALRGDSSDAGMSRAARRLIAARPTAVNLAWAVESVTRVVAPLAASERAARAFVLAAQLAEGDVATNAAIGEHGLALLRRLAQAKRGAPLQVMTHCNAGWLATVDWGTATAPLYQAHEAGLPLHVWVSETRPRNQGAALTAWELGQHGVLHSLVVDNACGHLMRRGDVDVVIVGTDRTAANGDVCNKIGTYLKAVAARDNGIPFYVAAPSSSIDFAIADGADIPIETRDAREVTHLLGLDALGVETSVRVSADSPVVNYGFDVTPARLVTGLITERGIVEAQTAALAAAFPDRVRA